MLEIINCTQGTDVWFAARLGLPTASEFSTVMAKGEGKTRRAYMFKLAGEILTGVPAEALSNAAMERGHEMEDEARNSYAFLLNREVEQIGFIRSGRKGYSPDGLVGSNGLVEFKSKAPHILIDVWERDRIPPEHVAQLQGGLWIAEREWIDFAAYWPGLPLFVKRAFRDDDYIATLSDEVDRFNEELDAVVDRMKGRFGRSGTSKEVADNMLMAGE